MIIDEEVYYIGVSLKDFGKKLFDFSKMEAMAGRLHLQKAESADQLFITTCCLLPHTNERTLASTIPHGILHDNNTKHY